MLIHLHTQYVYIFDTMYIFWGGPRMQVPPNHPRHSTILVLKPMLTCGSRILRTPHMYIYIYVKKHTSLLTSPLFRRYFTFSRAGQEMSSRQILILTTLINFFGLVNSTLKSWTAKQAMPAMLAVGIQDLTNFWRLGITGVTNWQFSTAYWLY
jgi:hypothetical protein